MSQPFYFLHISKTAGTSLRRVIEKEWPRRALSPLALMHDLAQAVQTGPLPLDRHPLFIGHLGYSLVQYLPEPPTIVTMLREPVARTISVFNYMLQKPYHWMHQEYVGKDLTLEAWLEDEAARNLITNFQVRNIALEFDLTQPFFDKAGNRLEPNLGRLLAYHATDNMHDRALLELAKKRLESFACVGLTERFDDSMRLLLDRMGWKAKMAAPNKNNSSNRVRRAPIAPRTIALIEELTQLDRELFDFAGALLDKRLEGCSAPALPRPGFIERLRRRISD